MAYINKKMDKIESFLYEAFCVDGTVKFDSFTSDIVRNGKALKGALYEINDKIRGKFYIAWLTCAETTDKNKDV